MTIKKKKPDLLQFPRCMICSRQMPPIEYILRKGICVMCKTKEELKQK